MNTQEWIRLVVELAAVAFAAGTMRQQLRELNRTVNRIEIDFTEGIKDLRRDVTTSVSDLTGRVNDHGERIGRLEGRAMNEEA